MVSQNQNVKCALKWRFEEVSGCTLFAGKEVENECKVATIRSLKEKNIFQGNERETFIQKKVEIVRD